MRCTLILVTLGSLCAVALLLLAAPTGTSPVDVEGEYQEAWAADGGLQDAGIAKPQAREPAHHRDRTVASTPVEEPAGQQSAPTVELLVVDRITGQPVSGALVRVRFARQPCDDGFEDAEQWSSDARGRIAIVVADESRLRDVHVQAEGYQPTLLCAVLLNKSMRMEMEHGQLIRGIVLSAAGEPLEGAAVVALHSDSDQSRPRATHRTGADGRYVLRDLQPGRYTVRADAPRHRSAGVGPIEAGTDDVTIQLQAGLGVTFRIRTLDTQVPEAPTVAWSTDVRGAPGAVELLQARLEAPGGDRVARVTLPAGGTAAAFEVKAIGYGPWRSGRVDTPAAGGELEFLVPLDRDQTVGRLVVKLERRTGELISAAEASAETQIARSDGQAVAAGVVYYVREVVDYPALPAGSYRVSLRAPAFAPVTEENVEVHAGQTVETRLSTGPAASLNVRFVGPDRATIEFRILAEGVPTLPYRVHSGARDTGASTASSPPEPTQSVDAGGATFTGLAAGPHTVVVVSKDWQAEETTIDLREGETSSVEIAVRRR